MSRFFTTAFLMTMLVGSARGQDPAKCSDYGAAWLVAQALGAGCAAESKFWDLKKANVALSATANSDVLAGCCTAFADATCGDWVIACASGTKVPTNAAPADGPVGQATFTTLTDSKFQQLCCVTPPSTCSSYTVAWATAQLLGGGCAADTKFFDLKKASVEFVGTADSAVKAACCTAFADATCGDWVKVCTSGAKVPTNAAPANGPAGQALTTLTNEKFNELCCVTPTITSTCSDYSFAWAAAQLLGGGCAADSKFFDLKKATVSFSNSGDADIKAACCTTFAAATCGDWVKSCSNGAVVAANVAAADGPAGQATFTTLTNAKFQRSCCPPSTCSSYSVAWATAQLLGGGCAADTQFFDLKKGSVEFQGTADSDVKTACCSAYADAKCADWVQACTTGERVSTNAAPADGGPEGATILSTLSDAKFQAGCCSSEPVTATSADVSAGATSIQLADVTGLSAGMMLTISDFSNSETKTIVSVTSSRRLSSESRRLAAGSVTLDAALQFSYVSGATVTGAPAPEADAAIVNTFPFMCIAVVALICLRS